MNICLQIIPFQERIKLRPAPMLMKEPKYKQKKEKKLKDIKEKQKPFKIEKKEKTSWTMSESKRYLKFLLQFQSHLQMQKKEKRRLKLNVKMSKVIKSRDPSQCHSHHQKMLIKYGSVSQIINFLKAWIGDIDLMNEKLQASQEKQTFQTEIQIQQISGKLDLLFPSQWDEEKQDEQMEVRLIDVESYQYTSNIEWYNFFV